MANNSRFELNRYKIERLAEKGFLCGGRNQGYTKFFKRAALLAIPFEHRNLFNGIRDGIEISPYYPFKIGDHWENWRKEKVKDRGLTVIYLKAIIFQRFQMSDFEDGNFKKILTEIRIEFFNTKTRAEESAVYTIEFTPEGIKLS